MDTAQDKPSIRVLGVITQADLQQELNHLLKDFELQIHSEILPAVEAICLSHFTPDVILLQMSDEEALRFSQLLHEDRYLALIPIILVYDNSEEHNTSRLMSIGASDLVSRPLNPESFLALIHKHEQTRQTWWETFHVSRPEYSEKLLHLARVVSHQEAKEAKEVQAVARDPFQKFKRFLYSRLGLLPDRIKYLQSYNFNQVYQLGDALFLDSYQTAEAIADFLELELVESFDGFKIRTDALPAAFCRRNLVLPMTDSSNQELIAMANPFQMEVVDILNRRFKSPRLMLAAPELIEEVLDPDFAKTERYREWKAVQHARSTHSLHKAKAAPLAEASDTTYHMPSPEKVASPEEESYEDYESADTGVDPDLIPLRPVRASLRIPVPAQEPPTDVEESFDATDTGQVVNEKEAQLMEQRLFRAYQAYRDQKQTDTPSATSMAALLASDRDPEVAPIIHLVNSLIEKAHLMGASDIHIEPWENEVVIRYRIDGQLRVMHRLKPQVIIKPLITRIKIMSQLDIAEKRLPQDGKIPFSLFSPSHDINLRVSIVPMRYGEKATLRLLDSKRGLVPLSRLGMGPAALELYRQKIHSPYGMILHVGPTGSGKTTTLYAALTEINRPDKNISTIENPIEYTLAGVNQLEIRHDIGLDFARVLRAFLRQDPDVLLVGEIRDEETAHVAVEAAMTGHLLFSTLHTNDAPSTIVRLLEMGLRPYMISSSLLLVCAQRLLRRLCPECRRPYQADADMKRLLKADQHQPLQLYAPVGCEHCNQGYSGRVGVYELLVLNDRLRRLINRPGVTSDEIKELARTDNHMVTLFDGGVEKVIEGVTSLEEITMKLLPDEHLDVLPFRADPVQVGVV